MIVILNPQGGGGGGGGGSGHNQSQISQLCLDYHWLVSLEHNTLIDCIE